MKENIPAIIFVSLMTYLIVWAFNELICTSSPNCIIPAQLLGR